MSASSTYVLSFISSLLNWVTSAKAPKTKEKKSDQQQCKEYLTSYETQKCRTVLSHLSKNRPWLRVESTLEHDIMLCDYCVKAGVSGDKCNFVRGCT